MCRVIHAIWKEMVDSSTEPLRFGRTIFTNVAENKMPLNILSFMISCLISPTILLPLFNTVDAPVC